FAKLPRLKERTGQVAGTLSGGEQQMLAIARALMSRPRLMLFDEPSLGLAPNLVERVFEIIAEIRREGTTVLMVEQNALAALEMSDRAYLLETGQMVLAGAGRDLLENPHVRRAYLGGGGPLVRPRENPRNPPAPQPPPHPRRRGGAGGKNNFPPARAGALVAGAGNTADAPRAGGG